ncbi:sigma-54-dependent Fis family transcriptional regulator [Oceanisphaera pacifica]|uniref:Sigma-54-dependent Fis family transcriptional regulator n=1 Tax=Oceanisphaera pacifica TaxID=2818389 RepID=A0ABS3NJK0_9GAMM|nr:sigma-54-dependent Fis family transcriptional regulator [Oceanisphaera pacifica]MBO1520769.1 sigma-54-dependent Fis family transcriptional regulator [Oceanisphaera pacifica]
MTLNAVNNAALTPPEQTPPLLLRSWQRSRDYGLSQHSHHAPAFLEQQALRHTQQQYANVLHHLNTHLPLFEQLQHGRRCRLLFADAQGTILFSAGDPYFGNKAQKIALASGASWHEQHMGTNAIGTALKEQSEVCILGQQHFLATNQGISCSASPVLSPNGELLGVIDISSEIGEHSQDMPLTAKLMALALENALVMNQAHAHWILNLAPDAGSLQQPWSGMVALQENGQVLGANRSARQWLPELDVPALLNDLTQGELTPVKQGMALLSRKPKLNKVRHSATIPTACAEPVLSEHERSALKLMNSHIPLLIQGETGTGKDHIVRRLHQAGSRASGPLIAVNCGALPCDLLEAELFGYVPGAFTGGTKQGRPGYIRAADKGVLFLDEIGELPLAAQTRLLRVLQEKTVTPLGCHKPEAVDFQLVVASHQDMTAMVEEGTFRQDLYFRINGYTLTLPPLRDYSGREFAALLQQLLHTLAATHSPSKRVTLSDKVITALQAYHWPGNIRQLKQQLAVAIVLADGDPIDLRHFAALPLGSEQTLGAEHTTALTRAPDDLKSITDQLIKQTLANNNGNVSATARQLKMSRTTIYARLKAIKPS